MRTDSSSIIANDMSQSTLKATIQLAVTKARKSPLAEYLRRNIKKEADIEEVRDRLAKIGGSMAEEIIKNRAERI